MRLRILSRKFVFMIILALFAHPDDETFGPGGSLARYAHEGHQVHLRTFTRGEAGTLGPARSLSREQLGELRTRELNCASRALHVSSLEIYGLPDGKLADIEEEEGQRRVRRELDLLSPDVLITFHEGGISGHPDHRTVAHWCLKVVMGMANPPRLLGYGITEEHARHITFRRLFPIPDRDVTHVIDVSPFLDDKLAAIQCHKSQAETWQKIQSVDGWFRIWAAQEHFCQAWPLPVGGVRPLNQL